jgi:ribosomal protein S18 acetylase RimI-like enzyme
VSAVTVRTAGTDDVDPLTEVVVASGLFPAEEADFVRGLLQACVEGDRTLTLVVEDGGTAQAVAYCRPLEVADRVWDLTMLAVRPDAQGAGVGSQLLTAVQDALRAQGQRLLVVETSGTEEYEPARRSYAHNGLQQQGTVRDYWADGDDEVVFTVRL